MKGTLIAAIALLVALVEPAHAANGTTPQRHFAPNRSLVIVGTSLFAAGYVPPVVAASPSVLALGAGVVGGLFTFSLLWWGCVDAWQERSRQYDPWYERPAESALVGSPVCGMANGGLQLLIPIAGPLVFIHDHPTDFKLNEQGGPLGGAARGWLIASTITQSAGALVLLGSLLLGHHGLDTPDAVTHGSGAARRSMNERARVATSAGPHLFVLPAAAGGLGVTLSVTGW